MGCSPSCSRLFFPAAQIAVTCSSLQACKEHQALCATFGYIASKIVYTEPCVFSKPHYQRGKEEIGCYESAVEDEGLLYTAAGIVLLRQGKERVLLPRYWDAPSTLILPSWIFGDSVPSSFPPCGVNYLSL